MATKPTTRTTKTPGATETTPEQTPAAEQTLLDEAPTQDAPTSDVGSTDTALPDMPTPGEMWETIQLLKQQLAAQQPQVKQAEPVASHVPALLVQDGRWTLTATGWAIKGDV